MAININPHHLNVASGPPGKLTQRPRERAASAMVPRRAEAGIIPEPETLATLIRSAVAALRQGARWDRGAILNILA